MSAGAVAPSSVSSSNGSPTVDLHAHTTASDGSATPTLLLERAAAIGLAAVAVTDHDTIDGVAEARSAGARLGIAVIAGVELSTTEHDAEVHVLGLHLEDTHALEPLLADLRRARSQRAEAMVGVLRALGVSLTLEAVLAEAGPGAVGRPHVARALIAGGWVRDQREAFDRYLGSGRPANVAKRRLPFAGAIEFVHAAGGIAVLAHPGRECTRARLEVLLTDGLDGVEVRHPGHSAEDIARLGALADHFGLVPSGGSDWHGASVGPRVLGAMHVPAAWVDRQRERAQRHRKTVASPWKSPTESRS